MLLAVPRYAIPTYALPSYALPGDYPEAPAAPSNPSATAISATQVDLAWTDNAEDVAGVNEEQTATTPGTLVAGSMNLVFDGETTAAINYNDTASDVQTKLRALASIAGAHVNVTGDVNELVIEFVDGLGAMDVPLITVASGPGDYTIARQCNPTLTVVHAGDESNPQVLEITWDNTPTAGSALLEKSGGGTATVQADVVGNVWKDHFNDLTSPGSYTGTGTPDGTITITATANGVGPVFSVSVGSDKARKITATTVTTTTAGSPQSFAELGFLVYRSTDGSSYSQLVDLGPNVTSYSDTSLSPSTQYWWKFLAYNAGGNSAFTSAVTATTPSAGGGGGAGSFSDTTITIGVTI